MDRAFRLMSGKADSWNAPLFLGEFGLDANAHRSGDYVAALYDRLDANLASGAQWNYTPGWTPERKDGWNGENFNIIEPNGRIRPNFRPRPFPTATAGTPTRFRFDIEPSPTLEFTWDHDPSRGSTDVFLPACLFPAATVSVQGTPGLSVLMEPADQRMKIQSEVPRRMTLRVAAPAPSRPRSGGRLHP